MSKQVKRKVGRPKRQPEHIDGLRLKALEGIERTRQRHDGETYQQIEELKEKVESLSARKKYSGKEIKELRSTVAEMYERHITEVNEQKALEEKQLNEALRCMHIDLDIKPSGKSLIEAEWNILHGLREDGSKPRGPKPRKKKQIWDLSPGERGNGTEQAEPIDIEMLEKKAEAEMFEREIQRKKDMPDFAVGKRMRKQHKTPTPRVDQSKFYY